MVLLLFCVCEVVFGGLSPSGSDLKLQPLNDLFTLDTFLDLKFEEEKEVPCSH